ncbi:hypothetical protein PAE9249_01014 [Paenibacillus sp. CECT 9249]|uniref:hypothetical protein n=1 Tax=Paenibacillus sp. CECT 9249 TaxID=2845385 RepID=UPI001E474F6A|nr:hypothetical protein [Paenibacillus sp. CECT 9249]CAH0118525.1 hypothetical protein PAE9249_01014 [Paenibacillus sp. CECT 9249]
MTNSKAASKPKSKKLTVAALNKLDAELNEIKTVPILGGQYQCSIDRTFRHSKIQELLFAYFALLEEAQQDGGIARKTLHRVPALLHALIVKYFTDLPLQSAETLENLTAVSHKLLDLGIMDQLFSGTENGFDPSQIEKVSKAIRKSSESLGGMLEETDKISVIAKGV